MSREGADASVAFAMVVCTVAAFCGPTADARIVGVIVMAAIMLWGAVVALTIVEEK